MFKEENVIEGRYKYEWGYEYIKSLEEVNCSAICCANDLIAIGAIKALGERNLKVPNDISVVGFDDIQTSKLINPPLTTIRQPAYEMGEKASEMLINYLKDENKDSIGVITFKPQLIVRNSTQTIN